MIDIKIGEDWRRIRPAEAKKAALENPSIRTTPKELNASDIVALVGKGGGKATWANATPMG